MMWVAILFRGIGGLSLLAIGVYVMFGTDQFWAGFGLCFLGGVVSPSRRVKTTTHPDGTVTVTERVW